MASPAISAQLRYLNNSAHRLATAAPGTSAYLMSRCNNLMFDHALEQTEAQRRHICGACGNIMILGLTGTWQVEPFKAQRRDNVPKIKRAIGEQAKAIIYTCELCSRQSRQHINTNRRRVPKSMPFGHSIQEVIQDTPSPQSSSANIISRNDTSSTASANATSKRRAKLRKQGGLQALLAKNKEIDTHSNSGGFGLDLLDLMKKA